MDQARFKIVFDGTLMPQTPLETAKENLARLFKSDTSKIDALFSGKPVVLKRDLSDDEADKYLRALHGAGANARKEAEERAGGLSLVETDDHPSEATAANQAPAETIRDDQMACPKCGHVQLKASDCAACGIIIERYLARQTEMNASAAATGMSASTASPYAPPQAHVGDELPEFGELRPFTTEGRIGRVRYLGWSMALFLVGIPIFLLVAGAFALSQTLGILLAAVVFIAYVVVGIMMGVQRLHDVGWSGWLMLLNIVPVVGSVFPLLMMLIPGNDGANRYGPPPPPNSRGVVALAWSMVIVPVVFGILAAIAIPSYEQYVERSHAAQYQQAEPDAAAPAEPSSEFNSGDTEGADSDDAGSTDQ
ncbi:DUF805 domain-containing protein [Pseudomonas sp. LA21]|uniref:DUF805 domain-containing protein n=1 Tax=unclassified Pseudomonas TaxID=196821 RepID=UPI001FB65E0C|nr:DUF805 domain-containing protein [Pseudomonas sp. LA21]MCJ1886680.1 DUF805 domain-containing protein [Pseudomonas sp. LA21]